MARVTFTRNLQRHVSCPPGEANGATVRECLEKIFAGNPQARGYVLDEHGKLRKHMSIYVNGEAIRDRAGLSDAVTDAVATVSVDRVRPAPASPAPGGGGG